MIQTMAAPRPLRVLYAFDGAPYPLNFSGGAERSCHETMAALAARGLQTMVIGSRRMFESTELTGEDQRKLGVRAVETGPDGVVYDCGYPVVVVKDDFEARLRRRMTEFAPDIVCTHLKKAIVVLRMAREVGAIPVWFIRDAECVIHPDRDLGEARALGARLMVSSPFLWNHLLSKHGADSTVLYPLVDPATCVTSRTGASITMINPVAAKGVGILARIVAAMPELPFLVCEGWRDSPDELEEGRALLRPYPNVRLVQATSDVREVFAQTRLLLVPSLWLEGFGRVALEAQFSGIPVIASRRGGLADFQDGVVLVEDLLNADCWIRTIRTVLDDQRLYARLSQRAHLHARRPDFSPDHLLDTFLRTVSAAA
jgi:glycosyltransferase involved in cell wall biosynthesis